MVAPTLSTLSAQFNITSNAESQLVFSIFVLACAVDPLFVGLLCGLYGCLLVLQLAKMWYLAFNLGFGAKEQMIVFRFLRGQGESAPLAIGGGVKSDVLGRTRRFRLPEYTSSRHYLGRTLGELRLCGVCST